MPLGSAYFKNLAGFQLTEAEFEDIPSPRAELITHVCIKDVQAFGLLGSMLIAPIADVIRRKQCNCRFNMEMLLKTCYRYGKWGAILGIPAGVAMAMGKMKSLEEPAIVDRCFRLRHNRNQVRVDQASIIGAGVGAGLGLMGASVGATALLGMNAGVIGAALYNNVGSSRG